MRRVWQLCVLLVASAAVVQLAVLPSRERNQRMARDASRLREEIGQLRRENGKLEQEIDALKSDPYYVEYMLRTRMHFRGPGEGEQR